MKKTFCCALAFASLLAVTGCSGGNSAKKSPYLMDECEELVERYTEKYGSQGYRWTIPKIDSYAGTEYNLGYVTYSFQRDQKFGDDGKTSAFIYSFIFSIGTVDDSTMEWMKGYTVSYSLANEASISNYSSPETLFKWRGGLNNKNKIDTVTFKNGKVENITFTADSKETDSGYTAVEYIINVAAKFLADENFSYDIFK